MKSKIYLPIVILVAMLLSIACKKQAVITPPGGGSGSTNKPPVADAGPDQTIMILTYYSGTASLNGSGSHDSSGMSMQFYWRQIAGPVNGFLQNAGQKECRVYSINTPGTYSFELEVWNTHGSDLDTTDITVSIPPYCQPDRSEFPVSLTLLSELPGNIQVSEIIAAGNKLFMPAWFNNFTGTYSKNIHVYDRITQNWTIIQASQARSGVATIATDGKVFFAGGLDSSFNAISVVDIYDMATNTWSVTNLSESRGDCQAVVSGSKIFFAGGQKNDYVLSNKVDIYDLETGSWSSSSLPAGARIVGAAVTAQNKVLFCGGYTQFGAGSMLGYSATTPTASIDIYDVNTGQWSVSAMQVNKGSFAAINVNEKVLLAGGEVNYAATFHVEELNVNTMNSSSSCLFQPMYGGGRTAIQKDDKLLFFAYARGFSGIQENKFDIYNIQTGVWSIGILPPDLIPSGAFTSVASVNDEIYAVIDNKLYKMNL
ncbi:MAG TPA: kelch repeat-containing protein [Chitinophagaceae bacterium]|nr:kelch repeat-containing protein [Chitinophagaceae bacterium]